MFIRFGTPWALHTNSRLEKRAMPVRLHVRLWLDGRWGTLAHSRNDYGEPAGLMRTDVSAIGQGVGTVRLHYATGSQIDRTKPPQRSSHLAGSNRIDVGSSYWHPCRSGSAVGHSLSSYEYRVLVALSVANSKQCTSRRTLEARRCHVAHARVVKSSRPF